MFVGSNKCGMFNTWVALGALIDNKLLRARGGLQLQFILRNRHIKDDYVACFEESCILETAAGVMFGFHPSHNDGCVCVFILKVNGKSNFLCTI